MSDAIALDLFLQDFIQTNTLLNQHYTWPALCNRRFGEDGVTKVFRFQSGGTEHLAIARPLHLPDAAWYRIELVREIPRVDEHRFDCMRMLFPTTHAAMTTELVDTDTVLVKLTTRHLGLMNIVFVIRAPPVMPLTNPFLV